MSMKADWIAAKAELDAIEAERNELLKPTNERYCAAQERLEEIEDECDGLRGVCEGCSNPIWDGEKIYTCEDGPDLCENCAPKFSDMLASPSRFLTFDDDGNEATMTTERAKEICDAHVAAGGSVTDSMAV